MIALSLTFVLPFELNLSIPSRVPAYWRSMNMTSGVSPIVPFLVLGGGLYAWFWYSLHGLALFGPDRCRLPLKMSLRISLEGKTKESKETIVLRMFSQQEAARPAEKAAIPMARSTLVRTALFFVLLPLLFRLVTGRIDPLRSLGAQPPTKMFCFWLDFVFSLLLAEAWQLLKTWRELKTLLTFLDRVALRRTFSAMKGFSWGSVWKMSGNVLEVRYKLLSRQAESLRHLRTSFEEFMETSFFKADDQAVRAAIQQCLDQQLPNAEAALIRFAEWYSANYLYPDTGNLRPLEEFQISMAALTGKLLARVLLPAWKKESVSLIQSIEDTARESDGTIYKTSLEDIEDYVRAAEEVVCLPYLGFIQNILGRMRTLAMGIVSLFVAVAVSVSTYPFDPRPGLSGAMILLFLTLCGAVSFVYAEMYRDSTLSNVTNTKPGELGLEFWFKILQFGIIPLLGLLASVFPGFAEFFVSWLQPGLTAVK